MLRLVIIRFNAITRVFQNTELHGVYSEPFVREELEGIDATKEQLNSFDKFVKDTSKDRIVIESSTDNKMWFAYITK